MNDYIVRIKKARNLAAVRNPVKPRTAMPLQIVPIPAFQDNYIWLLVSDSEAVCIDPGEAEPVTGYLKCHGLTLTQIWITHHHRDHTGGIDALLQAAPGCAVYGNRDIRAATHTVGEGSRLAAFGRTVEVWHLPGHTDTHLAYVLADGGRQHVFCGDTLFSAGCGRVFTGTPEQLFHSLQRLNRLPADTLFYPAHEYTAANLRFAAHIEPDNAAIAGAQAGLAVPSLPVSLAHERRINPFLRTDRPEVAQSTAALSGQMLADECAVFTAMRELKNGF